MKISESWLREWADPDLDTEGLARQLTMIGLEVDSIQPVAGELDKVVVGQVVDVQSHPEAERLTLCRVEVGAGEPLTIVCGAPNVRAGGRYPTALTGAQLAGGSRFSGAPSAVMFLTACSARPRSWV